MPGSSATGGDKPTAIVVLGFAVIVGALVLAAIAFLINRVRAPRGTSVAETSLEQINLQPGSNGSSYSVSLSELENIVEDGYEAYDEFTFFPDMNTHPVPEDVLEQNETLQLTSDQQNSLEALRDEMNPRFQNLAQQIVEKEQALQDAVANPDQNADAVAALARESAVLFGDLRAEVVTSELRVLQILTKEQLVLLSESKQDIGF